MNRVAFRNRYDYRSVYFFPDREHPSSRANVLLSVLPKALRRFDPAGVRPYLDKLDPEERSIFSGINRLLPDCSLLQSDAGYVTEKLQLRASPAAPLEALVGSLQTALSREKKWALSLSGGFDSALLLALLRRITGSSVPCFILKCGIKDYDETEAALSAAARLGGKAKLVSVTTEDLVSALPDCVTRAEAPIYNFHMCAKYLLAKSLAEAGIDLVFTGDGADQVASLSSAEDYLPIIGAIFSSFGVEPFSPFISDTLVSFYEAVGAEPDKASIRKAAVGLLPGELIRAPKVPRVLPRISRFAYPAVDEFKELSEEVQHILPGTGDHETLLLWSSLRLLKASHLS